MQLQEVFSLLSAGEFSQLSIGGANAGVIDGTNYTRVVGHINLGLTALYRRFNLKEGSLVLAMQEGVTLYHLHSSNAVSKAELGDTPYIIDTLLVPFTDDIIKIEKVTRVDDEGEVVELPLNDASDEDSVFTPSALKLLVPDDLEVQNLTVTYRANHPKLVPVPGGYTNLNATELELPYTHLDALLYYVASRVNNPIGMSNEFHAGNSYAAKYEMVCQELEGKGLQVDRTQSNDKLRSRGWV